MSDDVKVFNVERKLVEVDENKFICDIVIQSGKAFCRAEKITTGEQTKWIVINDTDNPAHSFGDYLKENIQ